MMRIRSFSLVAFGLLALLLVSASEAAASMAGSSGMLSSPGTFCTAPKLANSSYSSYGEADQFVKFTIWYSPPSQFPPSQRLYVQKGVTYFPEQTFNFAGWFQTCVINNSGSQAIIFVEEFYQ